MFSAHFAQLKWENHHPPPQNFLELLRILPSIQRSAFLADSMRVSTKYESECLTPPAGLNQGRYTWLHDSVLRILKRHLLSFRQSPLTQSTIKDRANLSTQPYIRFVPAGSASTQSTHRLTHMHLYSNNHHKRHPLSSSKDLLLDSNVVHRPSVEKSFL